MNPKKIKVKLDPRRLLELKETLESHVLTATEDRNQTQGG